MGQKESLEQPILLIYYEESSPEYPSLPRGFQNWLRSTTGRKLSSTLGKDPECTDLTLESQTSPDKKLRDPWTGEVLEGKACFNRGQ